MIQVEEFDLRDLMSAVRNVITGISTDRSLSDHDLRVMVNAYNRLRVQMGNGPLSYQVGDRPPLISPELEAMGSKIDRLIGVVEGLTQAVKEQGK